MIASTPEWQERLGKWLCDQLKCQYVEGQMQYIGLVVNGNISAVSGFEGYNGATVRGHMAITGRMNKEFIWFSFWYVFEQLKAHKLIGLVDSENTKAIRLDRHFGYVEEARINGGTPGGDMIIFTMKKEQCIYLHKFK